MSLYVSFQTYQLPSAISTNLNKKGDIMSTQTHSSLNTFAIIGGLLSDTVEVVKLIGSEVADMPDALAEGWNNGTFITPDSQEPDESTPTKTDIPTTAE